MTAFDVSAGISPRQSLESWSEFVAALEAEGVRRIWVIDSQLAMKDAYVGLTVAAIGTRRIGLGTGVTNAVTRPPTETASDCGHRRDLWRPRFSGSRCGRLGSLRSGPETAKGGGG